MKSPHFLRSAIFVIGLISTLPCIAQRAPRVLILVTSADKFADGRPTGLWLEEYATPYNVLEKAGIKVTVMSPKGGEAPVDPRSKGTPEQEKLWAHSEQFLHATAALSASAHADDYDAIFIPGGHGPLFDLAHNQQAARLISEFARSGKPVASVCHGPAALLQVTMANGVPFVKGKRLTSFSDSEEKAAGSDKDVPFSAQKELTTLGASYTKGENFAEFTVVDGTLVTGQNPSSSRKVAELLVEQIQAQRSAVHGN